MGEGICTKRFKPIIKFWHGTGKVGNLYLFFFCIWAKSFSFIAWRLNHKQLIQLKVKLFLTWNMFRFRSYMLCTYCIGGNLYLDISRQDKHWEETISTGTMQEILPFLECCNYVRLYSFRKNQCPCTQESTPPSIQTRVQTDPDNECVSCLHVLLFREWESAGILSAASVTKRGSFRQNWRSMKTLT